MLNKPHILIFIVAYNADKHIENVLNRIPKIFFTKYDYEILIIDDASKDNTFSVAKKYQKLNLELNLTVLKNPVNQGYGGNQKLGYHYAIEHKFDAVILLHGDGQYAPEMVEDMILPIINHQADTVFGSRMIVKGAALKGKMPLYKFAGNKILTFLENNILRSSLTEFHSGYRAYSIKTLQQIPFERNSNNFHFDTQIIIQLLLANQNIKEIPIPTYYGDEICHVDGIKYGLDIIKDCLASRLHQMSILYRREYDVVNQNNPYSLKLNYPSSHTFAINKVKKNSRVIDLGCNTGYLDQELKKKNCIITGVDNYSKPKPGILEKFHQLDLNEVEKLPDLNNFSFILLLDVIEHLDNPEHFMDIVRKKSKLQSPTIIITTGNVAFFTTRLSLLLGSFNYGKQGILDLTHKRLFTFKSLIKLCEDCGYKVNLVKGIPAPFPKAIGYNLISRTLISFNTFLINLSKPMFSYQIYLEATPFPVVSELLEQTLTSSNKAK